MNFIYFILAIAFASPSVLANAEQNPNKRLSALVKKAEQCLVQPFSLERNKNVVYHAIQSRCEEFQIVGKGKARIIISGQEFTVKLSVAEYTDGDFYHLTIRDVHARKKHEFDRVLAFGDVFLALLGGKSDALPLVEVKDLSDIRSIDRFLLN